MATIFRWMDKGEDDLTREEVAQLSVMVAVAEKYEDAVLGYNIFEGLQTP